MKEPEEKKSKIVVMAVPGPAFKLSKEEYLKLLESDKSSKNKSRLEKYRKFFEKIKNEADHSLDDGMSV